MADSLAAACGQFEQLMLAQMLRTASSIGRAEEQDPEDDDFAPSGAGDDAFAQLMAQALASSVERAGGIGLKQRLLAALERSR